MFKSVLAVSIVSGAWIVAALCGTLSAQVDSPSSLSGLSESQSADVLDNQPLDLNNEILIRLLYRVGKISKPSLLEFCEYSKDVSVEDVARNPRKYRFWVFDVSGIVVGLQRLAIPNTDSDDTLKFCYAVDIRMDSIRTDSIRTDNQQVVRVLARSVPKTWLTANAVGQPAQFYGLFFGIIETASETTGQKSGGLFLTNRISWRPVTENAELGVGPSQVLLANRGVDIGLLDVVRKHNTKPLDVEDSECFFQILAASRKIVETDMPGSPVRFVDLMQNPTAHFADQVVVEGRVRRCVPIQIEDALLQALMGTNEYYELDLFVQLGDQKVRVNNGPDDSYEYRHRFPVTVCVAALPEGMTVHGIENKIVVTHGFFYRFWRYQSEFTDEAAGRGGQVSPLVIGLVPRVLSPSASFLDRFLFLCLAGLIVVVIALLWFFRPSSGQSKIRTTLPETVDFSNVDSD